MYARVTITKAPEGRVDERVERVTGSFDTTVGALDGLLHSYVLLHRPTVTMYGIGIYDSNENAQRIDSRMMQAVRSGLHAAAGTTLEDVRLCQGIASS